MKSVSLFTAAGLAAFLMTGCGEEAKKGSGIPLLCGRHEYAKNRVGSGPLASPSFLIAWSNAPPSEYLTPLLTRTYFLGRSHIGEA